MQLCSCLPLPYPSLNKLRASSILCDALRAIPVPRSDDTIWNGHADAGRVTQETSDDPPSSDVNSDDWLLSQQVTHAFPGITALASLPAGEH